MAKDKVENAESILHRHKKEWDRWTPEFLDEEIGKMEKDIERVEYEVKMGAGKFQKKFLKQQKEWLRALELHKEERNTADPMYTFI
jgi:hypothetical protein